MGQNLSRCPISNRYSYCSCDSQVIDHVTWSFFCQDKNVWLSLIHMLNKKDNLPVVAFTLSRSRCNDNADALTSLDLTTSQEKHTIDVFFRKHLSTLKGSDQKLPQVISVV